MNGHEKRREEKKNAILQAALELFNQYGFDRVTLSEVAEKAHVSKVSIYNFFESKDNLRRVIINNILGESLDRSQALLEKREDFSDIIREYIAERLGYQGKVSLEFFFESVERDPVLKESFKEFATTNRELLKAFIEKGKQNGFFPRGISTTAIEIYIDVFQSYYVNSIQNKAVLDMIEHDPKLAEELNTLFWDGLVREQ